MNEIVQMFDAYANERGFGARMIYVEGVGFATYHLNDEECYIEDIYVVPEKRKAGEASALANYISQIAKENGAKYLTGTVIPSSLTATNTTKAMFAYGFKVHSSSENKIVFMKEI
jgi:GNAT superfamily N-acetyltransferase